MAKYQQLVDGLREALRDGDQGMADRFGELIRNKEYESESSGAASALQGLGQGATFGLADEAGAGVRSALFDPIASSLFGGDIGGVEGFKDYFTGMRGRYQQNLESQRGALETARREDPWTTGIAELAGGLGSGGVGMARSVGGLGARTAAREAGTQVAQRTLGEGIRQGAKSGLGYGALAGYGYSEGDPIATAVFEAMQPTGEDGKRDFTRAMEELKEAGVGTTVGGVMGGAFGAAMPLVGAGIRQIGKVVTNPFTRNARLTEVGRRQIADAIEQDIQTGQFADDAERLGITQKEFIERELAKSDMTVADLSPRLRQMTEDIAQTGTSGGRRIRTALTQRAEGVRVDGEVTGGQYNRIMPNLLKSFGISGETSNFARGMLSMQKSARRKADRMFGAAYRTPVMMTRTLHNALTKTDAGKAAMELARTTARNEQRKLPGVPKPGAMTSTRDFHMLMQGMDDAVDDAFKNLPNRAANSFKDVRNRFVREIEEANPGLAEARRMWGTRKGAEEAMEMGRSIFREDFDATGLALRRLNPNEKFHFRIGAMREIEQRMGRKMDVADMTRDLLKKRETRNALREVFGDEDKFKQFMNLLETENKMQLTFETAVGNSATARRLSQGATDFGEKLAGLAGYGMGISSGLGIPPSTMGFLGSRAYRASGGPARAQRSYEGITGAQSDMLMSDNLANIMQPVTMGGLLGTGAPASTAAATGGLLASGMINPEVQGRFGGPQ